MRQARFQIYPEQQTAASIVGHYGQTRYRWRLVAANNRVIADGGFSYSSRAATRRAIITMANTAELAPIENLDS